MYIFLLVRFTMQPESNWGQLSICALLCFQPDRSTCYQDFKEPSKEPQNVTVRMQSDFNNKYSQ